MGIRVIPLEDSKSWDSDVHKLKEYDVFYLSDYLKAFELTGCGEPKLAIYENNSDYAIMSFFVRDIADDKHLAGRIPRATYYDLSSPYGYGGFIGNVSDYNMLNQEWNKYCLDQGYISEFVRFELFSEARKHYDGEVETRTHNVVRDLVLPIDEMWMDFKQKVRKNVKRANSYGLEIVIDDSDKYLDDFLRIYYGTMNRTDAEDEYFFPKEFFKRIAMMKDNMVFFHVLHEGRVISTELVLYGAEYCYSYLGGTDKEYFEMRPNDYLKFEIIKWAKEKGLKGFVLGGGYGKDDGIFQYKLCLAPKGCVDFYIGRKVFNKDVYKKLVELRTDIKDLGFFPAYRG